jgi:large subunit ribosomal protein LP1
LISFFELGSDDETNFLMFYFCETCTTIQHPKHQNVELACVCAALVLADVDVAITGEKIQTILKAAKEPYWPGLFAKALEGVNVKDLLSNVGPGVGAAGAAPAAGAAISINRNEVHKAKIET